MKTPPFKEGDEMPSPSVSYPHQPQQIGSGPLWADERRDMVTL